MNCESVGAVAKVDQTKPLVGAIAPCISIYSGEWNQRNTSHPHHQCVVVLTHKQLETQ